jgi:hypothetical protein
MIIITQPLLQLCCLLDSAHPPPQHTLLFHTFLYCCRYIATPLRQKKLEMLLQLAHSAVLQQLLLPWLHTP